MFKAAEFFGLRSLFGKFKKLQEEARRAALPVVRVGFTAAYALYVHERVEMKWKGLPRGRGFSIDKQGRVVVPSSYLKGDGKASGKNRGFYWDPQGQAQAKFLEQPARELSDSGELGRIVAEMYKQTGSLEQALLAAGLRIQREAMLKTPVDTGNLKNSAFTRKE